MFFFLQYIINIVLLKSILDFKINKKHIAVYQRFNPGLGIRKKRK